ncbi:MAG: polymer-forming cytoskeletal protein [Acidobacteria bacterium]|nr:MAG: polymer-forming cytoskeletal protein [Acidobacteriota bacterium]REK08393.1 MAG: polymer-forming cytoskeletal protein [Acidobacteriota bacterium]
MAVSNPANSILGSTITIQGELVGQEDIQISGRVEGEIRFAGNTVTISRSAQIDAGIQARRIEVEGTVNGNLEGSDEVVIRKTGRVEGNLKAPRVTLEDGATFRGSVDMRSKDAENNSSTADAKGGGEAAKDAKSGGDARSSNAGQAAAPVKAGAGAR